MFDCMFCENWLIVKVVIGFWLVNLVGDDIYVYVNEICEEIFIMLYMFR